jgi:hypothetical protein
MTSVTSPPLDAVLESRNGEEHEEPNRHIAEPATNGVR